MRKSGEIVVGICFLGMGMGFTIGAIHLQIGRPTEPQPGFFPFLDGVTLIVLSSIFIFQALRGRMTGETHAFGKLRGPTIVILGLILYVATLDTLGYIIATAFLSAVMLWVLETRLRVLAPVSLLLSVGSYTLFSRLLGVTLPGGLMAKIW